MKLGGWSRVGIVLSVLYGAMVAHFAYDGRPRLENLQSDWLGEAAEAIAMAKKTSFEDARPGHMVELHILRDLHAFDIANSLNMPGNKDQSYNFIESSASLEKLAASSSENERASRLIAAISRLNAKHKALLAELPSRQREYWILAFAWWVGGIFLLFGAGWTIRWVYQGFRRIAD